MGRMGRSGREGTATATAGLSRTGQSRTRRARHRRCAREPRGLGERTAFRSGDDQAGRYAGARPQRRPDGPQFRLRRRSLLLEASSALALVAAAPVLEVPWLAGGSTSSRVRADLAIVTYTAEVVAGLRRLGGVVGPRITCRRPWRCDWRWPPWRGTRRRWSPAEALTAYGDLTQLIGWLMFNLGDHKAARYYYDDARSAAYRAGNNDLAAYALSASCHVAIAQGRFRQAIDHAQAAQHEARASGSPYALAYACDVTARAYARLGR